MLPMLATAAVPGATTANWAYCPQDIINSANPTHSQLQPVFHMRAVIRVPVVWRFQVSSSIRATNTVVHQAACCTSEKAMADG
jgi:hypothetical protein